MAHMEAPSNREARWPGILFGLIGTALGIAEAIWLRLHPLSWPLMAAVFFALGLGFGFDVARQCQMPRSAKRTLLFSVASVPVFVLFAAMCGGAGLLLNKSFFGAASVPQLP